MTHRIVAPFLAAALAATATAQAAAEAAPSAAAAADRLMRALDRVEAAAKSIADSRREAVAVPDRRGVPEGQASDASTKEPSAERIRRIEQQLEDQRAANGKALHVLEQQLAALRETAAARTAEVEKERDAALQRQLQLSAGQRELLVAVRAQRLAVDSLLRELKAQLGQRDQKQTDVEASPRQ